MGVWICPECGKKVSDKLDKCVHCGYEAKAKAVCPDCGAEIEGGLSICPECGSPLKAEPAKGDVVLKVDSKIDSVICPQCGFNEVVKKGDGEYECQGCHTTFLLNKGPKTVVMGDVIHKYGDKRRQFEVSDYDETLLLKPTIDEEDALISMMYFFKNCGGFSPDIFESEIGTPELKYAKFAGVLLEDSISYSGSAGYSKTETAYDNEGHPHYSTRTDWRPYSGTAFVKKAALAPIKGEPEFKFSGPSIIDSMSKKTLKKTKASVAFDVESFEKAVDAAGYSARASVNLPGEVQKDEFWTDDINIGTAFLIEIPYYEIPIKCNGSDYLVRVCAVEHSDLPAFVHAKPEKKLTSLDASKRKNERAIRVFNVLIPVAGWSALGLILSFGFLWLILWNVKFFMVVFYMAVAISGTLFLSFIGLMIARSVLGKQNENIDVNESLTMDRAFEKAMKRLFPKREIEG